MNLRATSGVLGAAVAEGPVFLVDLDKIDQHVFPADMQALVQAIRDDLPLQSPRGCIRAQSWRRWKS
jgi:hypothetical protein